MASFITERHVDCSLRQQHVFVRAVCGACFDAMLGLRTTAEIHMSKHYCFMSSSRFSSGLADALKRTAGESCIRNRRDTSAKQLPSLARIRRTTFRAFYLVPDLVPRAKTHDIFLKMLASTPSDRLFSCHHVFGAIAPLAPTMRLSAHTRAISTRMHTLLSA